jgi:ribose-phosphate pyrophosphokinase
MTAPLFIAMPGNDTMTRSLARVLGADVGRLELHAFPDGETYLRFGTPVSGRALTIVCTLDHPNDKVLPLLFAAATGHELGAARVGLVAPYLAYMRQDRRFKPGEAVTSRQVADLISQRFDWMGTVDPHLHRYGALSEIYRIPTEVIHAAPLISSWIRDNVDDPIIIGPDSESAQWVSVVANDADAPFTVLDKVRRGDRDVQVSLRDERVLGGRTPVLVDDIVSTGRTMLEAVRLLAAAGKRPPICVAVHGLFADGSDRLLADAGARVVTTNTVPHPTNAIDVHALLAAALRRHATADDAGRGD